MSPSRTIPGWAWEGLAVAAVVAVFAALAGPFLVRVASSWVPAGWDGIAHFSIADLYARRVFPRLSGWVPEFFAGMPFPDFYPPLFYFVVAALAWLGLSTAAAFWTVQIACSAAMPLLAYASARRIGAGRLGALVTGILAVGYLIDTHPIGQHGITLHATFDIGLATQLIGFCAVLVAYFFLLGSENSRRDAVAAAVALALIPLANAHVVWNVLPLVAMLLAVRCFLAPTGADRLRILLHYGKIGGISLLLASPWLLPMLSRLDFVPTLAMDPPSAQETLAAFLRLGVYVILAGVVAWSSREPKALALALGEALLLLLGVLPWARLAPDLALQPTRFLVGFEFLALPLVGYLVGGVARLSPRRLWQGVAAAASIAVFFAYVDRVREPSGVISPQEEKGYAQVLSTLRGKTDGRVWAEMGASSMSDAFALQSLLGRNGNFSLATVFRESSISALFAAPLRNSLAFRADNYGVDSKLPPAQALAAQLADRHLARLRLFNVRYFVAWSDDAKARIAALPGTARLLAGDPWSVYALQEPPRPYARIPAFQPVLTFAPWSVKRRGDGFDFVRLNEEMFASGRLDIPLALARGRLDESRDWELFQVALVTDYRAADRDRAFAGLERFSRSHPLVLLADRDPLFARLEELAASRPNIHVVPRLATPSATIWGLLDTLEAVRIPIDDPVEVRATALLGERTSVRLSARPRRPLPVWILESYLPNWVNPAGAPVYLATPTFQLTFASAPTVDLRFVQTRAATAGWGLGVVGLGLLLLAFRQPPARVEQ